MDGDNGTAVAAANAGVSVSVEDTAAAVVGGRFKSSDLVDAFNSILVIVYYGNLFW
jgi:hypothetical protein